MERLKFNGLDVKIIRIGVAIKTHRAFAMQKAGARVIKKPDSPA
jgi:hypothetical protein